MKKLIFVLSVFSLLSIMALPLNVQAIGQMTQPIDIKDALRGQKYQSELIIVNTDKKEVKVDLTAEGQVKDWTKFYQRTDLKNAITSATATAGATLNIIAEFTVATTTANGVYTGAVSVTTKPDTATQKDQSYASIAQKIDREVTITVSDKENINLQVSVIPNKYDFASNEAMKIRFIYDNQSNINLSPQIQFKITQNDKTFYNAIFPYPENDTPVTALSQHEIPTLEIPTSGLGNGKYVAQISFLHNGKSISEKQFGFSVGMFSGFGGWVKGIKITSLTNNWLQIILVLAGLAVVAGAIVFKKKIIKQEID